MARALGHRRRHQSPAIGFGTRVGGDLSRFHAGHDPDQQQPLGSGDSGERVLHRQNSDGEQLYTRNGQFKTNANNELVTLTGERVLGFGVNDDFEIQQTSLVPLSIPLGTAMVARPTENVVMQGASPSGDVATAAGVEQTATLGAAGGGPLTASTLLTDVVDTSQGTTPIFDLGQLQFTPTKGDRSLSPRTLAITATSTVQNLMDFMQQAIGIQTTANDPLMPTSADNIPTESGTLSPGVVLQNGQIRIVSNNGTGNSVTVIPPLSR